MDGSARPALSRGLLSGVVGRWDACDTFITHYVYRERNVRKGAISSCCCVDLLEAVEEEPRTARLIITDQPKTDW